jgi:hypothetical protein
MLEFNDKVQEYREISPCRILGRAKRSGELSRIPHLTMIMGDHPPESPEGFRRGGDTKLGLKNLMSIAGFQG